MSLYCKLASILPIQGQKSRTIWHRRTQNHYIGSQWERYVGDTILTVQYFPRVNTKEREKDWKTGLIAVIANSILAASGRAGTEDECGPWKFFSRRPPNQRRSPQPLDPCLCTVFLSNVFGSTFSHLFFFSIFYNVYSHKEKKIQCRYESPRE